MSFLINFFRDFKSLFYEDIVRRNKTTPFLIFIFLILSFGGSRIYVNFFEGKSLFIRGYHIHHFYFGLILLLIAGYIALLSDRTNLVRFSAILYGAGAGMMLDEVGLFLTCGTLTKGCDYWARVTYDVLIVVVGILLAIIYFVPFWNRMRRSIFRGLYRILSLFDRNN